MQAEHSSKGDEYAREAEGQAPPAARARSIAHRTSHAHTHARAHGARTHARFAFERSIGTALTALLFCGGFLRTAADPARPDAAQRRPRGAHVAHHGAVGRDVGNRYNIRPSRRWHTCLPLLPHNSATSLPAPIRTRAQRTAAFAFGVGRGPVVPELYTARLRPAGDGGHGQRDAVADRAGDVRAAAGS